MEVAELIIQDVRSQLYLGGDGQWRPACTNAMRFESASRALDWARSHGLDGSVRIVWKSSRPQCDWQVWPAQQGDGLHARNPPRS